MRLRQLAGACVLALAVTLAAPAQARHRHGPGERPDWQDDGLDRRPAWKRGHPDADDYGPMPPGPDFVRIHDDWLAECRMRVAERAGPAPLAAPGPGDACETALDDYYAALPPGYDYGGYGPGLIMVPVTIPGNCVEHVTTRDVPARRIIPRRAPRPDKRIRIVPDKRVPIS